MLSRIRGKPKDDPALEEARRRTAARLAAIMGLTEDAELEDDLAPAGDALGGVEPPATLATVDDVETVAQGEAAAAVAEADAAVAVPGGTRAQRDAVTSYQSALADFRAQAALLADAEAGAGERTAPEAAEAASIDVVAGDVADAEADAEPGELAAAVADTTADSGLTASASGGSTALDAADMSAAPGPSSAMDDAAGRVERDVEVESLPDEPLPLVAVSEEAEPVVIAVPATASRGRRPIALPANAVAVMSVPEPETAAAVSVVAVAAPQPAEPRARAPRPRSIRQPTPVLAPEPTPVPAAPARPAAPMRPAAPARPAAKPAQPAAKRRVRVSTLLPAACPTCGRLLDEVPTATRRCVDCRQRIVVKRVDGRIVLIAEAVAPIFEAERRRLADGQRVVRESGRWLRLAALAGAPADVLEARARAVAARPTAEAVPAARALYATTVDRACRAARKAGDWRTVADLRWRQARAYHHAAGMPTPPEPATIALHREGIEASLRNIAQVARDAELVGGACCDTCSADAGRVVRINAELKAGTLPHGGCPMGLCGCRWDISARHREAVAKLARRRSPTSASAAKAKGKDKTKRAG